MRDGAIGVAPGCETSQRVKSKSVERPHVYPAFLWAKTIRFIVRTLCGTFAPLRNCYMPRRRACRRTQHLFGLHTRHEKRPSRLYIVSPHRVLRAIRLTSIAARTATGTSGCIRGSTTWSACNGCCICPIGCLRLTNTGAVSQTRSSARPWSGQAPPLLWELQATACCRAVDVRPFTQFASFPLASPARLRAYRNPHVGLHGRCRTRPANFLARSAISRKRSPGISPARAVVSKGPTAAEQQRPV